MLTYRTVVAARDALAHLESWVPAGTAPGCAGEYTVRADTGFASAGPPGWHRLRFAHERPISVQQKGSWRANLTAQRVARPTVAGHAEGLCAETPRLLFDSLGGDGSRIGPGRTSRSRYVFWRAGSADAGDIPAASNGAHLHVVTPLPHRSDPVAATQELHGRTLIRRTCASRRARQRPRQALPGVSARVGFCKLRRIRICREHRGEFPPIFFKTFRAIYRGNDWQECGRETMPATGGHMNEKMTACAKSEREPFRASPCRSRAVAAESEAAAKETL